MSVMRTVYDVDGIRRAIHLALARQHKTQRALAEELGVTEKHVSHMMTGRNGISLPVLFAIINYLDLELVLVPGGKV